jgi:anti-anti-sigma factor
MNYLKKHTNRNVLVIEILVEAVLDPLTVESVLKELLQAQQANGQSRIVIDFSNVQLIGAGMLGALLTFRSMTLYHGGALKLSGLDRVLSQIFEVTTLKGLFEIHRTEEEAISSLCGAALSCAA